MPTLPKVPPSSLRVDKLPPGSRIAAIENRPYLVPASSRRREAKVDGSRVKATFTLFAHESEDARITGSTRSLYRRLLALNLPVTQTEVASGKPSTSVTKFPARIASA